MKNFLIYASAAMLLLFLTSCSNWSVEIKEPESGAQPGAQVEIKPEVLPAEDLSETLYPLSGGWAWLDSGETFAAQNGFTVRFLDKNNAVKSEITLAPENMNAAGRCVFSNNRIFMPFASTYPDLESFYTLPIAINLGGEYKLYGGAFFDRSGKLLRELPYIESRNSYINTVRLSTGEEINLYDCGAVFCERRLWLDDDLMIFGDSRKLFYYRISEDKLTLAVDFSEKVPEGKGGMYHGIYNLFSAEGGLYITYNDDTSVHNIQNLASPNEDGLTEILSGAENTGFSPLGGKLAALEHEYNQERDCIDESTVYFLEPNGEKRLIIDLPGSLGFLRDGSERLDFVFEHIRDNIYYLCSYDLETGELYKFDPELSDESMGSYRDIFTGKVNGELCWFYNAFYDGYNHFTVYNSASGETKELWKSEYLSGKLFLEANPDGSAAVFEVDQEGEVPEIQVASLESLFS